MKNCMLIATLLATASIASAQIGRIRGRVPIGGMGQHIVARNYTGVDCGLAQQGQVQLSGRGTAALYFPYIAGIPEQYLFSSTTQKNETTALITGVFSIVELSQVSNGPMRAIFLKDHDILYYYHPNSSPKDWTDLDGFAAGQHIATYHVQKNMFSQIVKKICISNLTEL